MGIKKYFFLMLFVIIAATGSNLWADMISIWDVVARSGAEFRWDPYREMGLLTREESSVSFKVGQDWVVGNYTEKMTAREMITTIDGEIFFGEELSGKIVDFFIGTGGNSPEIGVILIDPGHGGKDPGTIGTHTVDGKEIKLVEKEIVLTVAMSVYEHLSKKFPRKKILMTRDTDVYPTLDERVELANSVELAPNQGIIYISIHANASFNSRAKGFEVWYLPPEVRRDVLDEETAQTLDESLIPIFNSMKEEEYTIESVLLAKNILQGMDESVKGLTENRGLKEESFFVVRKAKMPSVLIEMGYVTNKTEALNLIDEEYLQKLARGIYNGIVGFVNNFENTKGFTEK